MPVTPRSVRAWAPGRVNLIGDHTDYTGGLALPMAIQLGIAVEAESTDTGRIVLSSHTEPTVCDIAVGTPPAAAHGWARYVAAVADTLPVTRGLHGAVRSTLPAGAGLSSSAALEIALFLAMGALETPSSNSDPIATALACQQAELSATGVPCGLLDQMAILWGQPGCAVMIDAHQRSAEPVTLGPDLAVWIVHSGVARRLETSAYAQRRAECERAESHIGPLRLASDGDVTALADPILRARARHVVSENQRVRDFVAGLRRLARGPELGALMLASHRSLRDDFEVSTPELDTLVDELTARPGVWGARLTGAGFGGCAVVLGEPDLDLSDYATGKPTRAWRIEPSAGAVATSD